MSEKRIQGRKNRIARLLEMLKEYPNEPTDKIIAEFSIETGVTIFTEHRYLKVLRDAGEIPKRKN